MNGSYGGGFDFDFVDGFNFAGGNGDQQDQHQHQNQHQQIYRQNAGQFDLYDPSILQNRSSSLFQNNNRTYNSTAATHHAFLPPLDSAPSVSLQMNHTRMLQPQQHQQQYASSNHAYVATFMPCLDSIQNISSSDALLNLFPDHNDSLTEQADKVSKENPDLWLDQLQIKCPDVSLQPLSGAEVLKRVRAKTDDVVTRYLPCVEFLVKCQQELRAGLLIATQKRMIRHVYRDALTPKEFHKRYLSPYPTRFHERNANLMESQALDDAVKEINCLCQDAKRIEYQGCEMMKNTFLGGMKDGESWGLRKWLSSHGGALHICNDLECMLRSCQALDRSQESTRKLCERLRPLAQQALDRLKNDVPPSYQEVSTAHPYLPFFHRLESALKAMANFDPEDDDVICIESDDDSVEIKPAQKPEKRQLESFSMQSSKRKKQRQLVVEDGLSDLKPAARSFGRNAYASVIEVVDKASGISKSIAVHNNAFSTQTNYEDWECRRCTMLNSADTQRCCMCDRTIDGNDCDSDDEVNKALATLGDFPFDENCNSWDPMGGRGSSRENSVSPLLAQIGNGLAKTNFDVNLDISDIATGIENIARAADCYKHGTMRPHDVVIDESFWDVGPQFACALRLLVRILLHKEAQELFDQVDDTDARMLGYPAFSSVIKHPLCLREIAQALIVSSDGRAFGSGQLSLPSLSSWNMWRGMDLLQALDLVLLNNLAYYGKEKTQRRSATNRLRKSLWDGINEIIFSLVGDDTKRKECTPTRRGENSGFVIQK